MYKEERKKYVDKMLMYIGFGLAALVAIAGIVLMYNIAKWNILPKSIIVVGVILMLLIGTFIAFMQRWRVSGIIFKIVALALAVVMIAGTVYSNITYKAVNKVTGTDTQIDQIVMYVRSDDAAQSIDDVMSYRFGIINESGSEGEAITIALDKISKAFSQSIAPTKYESVVELLSALLEREIDAILVNDAVIALLEGVEGYENVASTIKAIWNEDIEIEVPTKEEPTTNSSEQPTEEQPTDEQPTEEQNVTVDKNIFTVYVSGADVYGPPNTTRNSDVNILVTVNMNTHEVVMINTPRDYYVPIPVFDNNCDKLTHAGTKGIQASIDTLAQLYGVDIDYYLRINFTGFTKIVDAMGGVNVYSAYDFNTVDGKHFSQGNIILKGEDALSFVRERYNVPGGDRGRGINQMALLNAMISKLSSADVLMNYTNILNAISDCMVTNMSMDRISELVRLQLNDMKPFYIKNHTADGTGDHLKSYALGFIVYMMVPNEDTVNQARNYLKAIYNNESIK